MKRCSKKHFINSDFNKDNIVALRFKENTIQFLGWMENAENYTMQIGRLSIDKDEFVNCNNLCDLITHNEGYDKLCVINADADKNEYAEFLSYMNDAEIVITTQSELQSIWNLLRDGEYVFIIQWV